MENTVPSGHGGHFCGVAGGRAANVYATGAGPPRGVLLECRSDLNVVGNGRDDARDRNSVSVEVFIRLVPNCMSSCSLAYQRRSCSPLYSWRELRSASCEALAVTPVSSFGAGDESPAKARLVRATLHLKAAALSGKEEIQGRLFSAWRQLPQRRQSDGELHMIQCIGPDQRIDLCQFEAERLRLLLRPGWISLALAVISNAGGRH